MRQSRKNPPTTWRSFVTWRWVLRTIGMNAPLIYSGRIFIFYYLLEGKCLKENLKGWESRVSRDGRAQDSSACFLRSGRAVQCFARALVLPAMLVKIARSQRVHHCRCNGYLRSLTGQALSIEKEISCFLDYLYTLTSRLWLFYLSLRREAVCWLCFFSWYTRLLLLLIVLPSISSFCYTGYQVRRPKSLTVLDSTWREPTRVVHLVYN